MMAEKNKKSSSPPIRDSAYRTRYAPTVDTDIYYPESDEKPMAETELHRDGITTSIQTLSLYYIDDMDVCVSGNLMMYYVEGNPKNLYHQTCLSLLVWAKNSVVLTVSGMRANRQTLC